MNSRNSPGVYIQSWRRIVLNVVCLLMSPVFFVLGFGVLLVLFPVYLVAAFLQHWLNRVFDSFFGSW